MSWSMNRAGLPVAVAVVMLAAGCSGDDAASSTSGVATTTEPPATSTTVGATTEPTTAATTTEPTTTVPESTTSIPDPTTTTSPPAGVPPRVTFPDDPDKQAVVDAAYAFFDAARAAQAAPEDDALRTALDETMTDPIAARLTAFVDQLVLDGVRVVASSEHPTYLEILPFTVSAVDASGTFDACSVDGDVRVSGDGQTVVSADIGSVFLTYSLTQTGDRWSVRDVSVFSRYPGEIGCDGD